MPLFVAMGAAGARLQARHLHDATTYGILAMDIFAFGNDNAEIAVSGGDTPHQNQER